MRSARKFSLKPVSAIPGRLMSLTVIGTRDSTLSERSSKESASFCCSYSCATVSVGGTLVELKQSDLAVGETVCDPEPFFAGLLEHEHRLLALQECLGGFLGAQHRARGPLTDQLDLGPGGARKGGRLDRGGLDAEG